MATLEEKIANIAALRFPERKMVKRMIAACQLEGAVIDMDKNGFFAHSFTMPDWLANMPTAAELAERKAAENPVAVTPAKRKAPVTKNSNGACARIREWARANPEATKEDGVKQFPDLNPSTIQIQMRKVRLGLV